MHRPTIQSIQPQRQALTLLEVMLALVILGAATAVLVQSMQLASDSGVQSQELLAAQLIAESKMSEIVAGLILPEAMPWTPVRSSISSTQWYIQLQLLTPEIPDMIGVLLQVTDDPNRQSTRPTDYQLVRWMIDPALGLDQLPTSGSPSDTSSSSLGGAGSASSSGGTSP
jgi:type II secretory pathway pseudopilin PulG